MAKRRNARRGARTARRPASAPVDPKKKIAALKAELAQALKENARLFEDVQAKTRDLEESLKQQTATSEVLQIISASPGDLAPVFDKMLENATRVCGAEFGSMTLVEDDSVRQAALYNAPAALAAARTDKVRRQHPQSALSTAIRTKQVVHVADLRTTPAYLERALATVELIELGGARTIAVVPMLREDEVIGAITIYRQEVRPFTDKQIELVSNFAKQAVIAIENARLLTETREALKRQTATADVLKVINSSPGDLAPVFDAILEKAHRLCGVRQGSLQLYDGSEFRAVAVHGLSEAFADRLRKGFGPYTAGRRLLEGERFVQIQDLGDNDEPMSRAAFELAGVRTVLFIPLRKDGKLLGRISASRMEVKPFTHEEIGLLESFAAQAVIAIENARLFEEVQARTRDLEESLRQQTAMSEVLQVISSSPGDLVPVFDKMLENATRVCGAEFGSMVLVEDGSVRQVALYNVPTALAAARTNKVFRPHPQGTMAAAIRTRQAVQVADVRTTAAYLERAPYSIELVELGGARTVIVVPMLREDEVIGAITIYRQEVRLFADKQIELVSNFAKQAVIAIENARLLTETREALERQTATAEVLQVINSSPGDLAPVFEAILEKAHSLCAVAHGSLLLYDGEKFRGVASRGQSEAFAALLRKGVVPGPNLPHRRLLEGARFAQVPDWAEIDDPFARAALDAGLRTTLYIPLRGQGKLLGYIAAARREVRPFSEKEIGLLESFAAQAVIAMENARLLGELRERTTELARSVDELTATSDVLKIISRSSVELNTVLDTLVETVARLCRADQALIFRRRDDLYHLAAAHGVSGEAREFMLAHPLPSDRGSLSGRVELERRAFHIPDVLQDPEYTYWEGQKKQGQRTMLGVPLLREDSLIGIFCINRTRVDPFTTKEIELATTFADQAVIAIENARLFDELRERQAELRVTFDNMGDGVVMFGADTRLVAWNRNFQEIIDLPDTFLGERPSYADYFRYLAARGEYSADLEAELGRTLNDTSRELRFERTRPDGRIIEVRRNAVPGGGFVLIYADITERKQAEEAIRTARDAAETALRDLQAAQASLVHAQKMAALGQLTAGIAHEIKNPLNFVNNFAALSVELLEELKEAAAEAIGTLRADKRDDILETIKMLTGNLEKIAEHGRRADGIVRSMLQHSRGSSGDRHAIDVNALVEETLNLAYHGARAQDRDFEVTLELDLERNLAPIEVVSQDVSRALLNLISNGFYAVTERGRDIDGAFRPTLKIATRGFGEGVEIRVRDNGIGIAPEYWEKLFQPFFTTKPTGEGTGLGLSISYEIITQQHGGTITVDSKLDDFTEFTVRLPRRRPVVTLGH